MTAPTPATALDEVDRQLLAAVQRDARASLTALAATIHLGVSATRARLRGLEERGVITGYTARVDPVACGLPLRAVVRMKVHGALYDKVAAVLAREPQIVRCVRVTGEACYVAEILAADMPDLARITSELALVGSITTDLVYEVVADRAVPSLLRTS
ncbi:Lrp/AsnC family transcriptional regulator [Dactylosporangium aurantiacum]|uniref:Lrp/AsnC family transcriptional regulator n=1 Tax=Dactylosporangium aurantiacum TaxID=35754 RepID=A0A9Q9ILB9_9ACTN|nr:Lrp/AsnC family transcriptional regulator [Dactylosporangium aurantiacum]MDG6103168.1 Lrp/AsnC family transcriptional regulator [Dactylosporangium aurantiacum]UWZ57676.1 Lrp/AsnC family transcriptional regulator [Dactylosporangium aurantiacum]